MNILFRFLRLIFFTALALLMVGLVIKEKPDAILDPLAGVMLQLVKPAEVADRAVTIEIAQGASGADVAAQMAQKGLVRNPLLFRVLLNYYDIDRNLRAGRYTFPAGTDLAAILKALGSGATADLVTVTVPEGWRSEQIADLLESSGVGKRTEFLGLVNGDPLGLSSKLLGFERSSLEGYLFPDTYLVPKDYGAQPFLILMLQTFGERFDARYADAARETIAGGASGSSLSKHEVVILASIVEREARLPEERGLIAGVFGRRLTFEMPLAADPTIQYALVAKGSPEPAGEGGYWKRYLTPDDLKLPSPYNTYVVQGLPPSPICNPGLAALEAVLHPARTNALYFVARPDGSHAFATTFEEHQANVFRYQ